MKKCSNLHGAPVLVAVGCPVEEPVQSQLHLLETLAFGLTSHGLQALRKVVLLQLNVFRYVIQNLGSVVTCTFAPAGGEKKRQKEEMRRVIITWNTALRRTSIALTERERHPFFPGTSQSNGHCSHKRSNKQHGLILREGWSPRPGIVNTDNLLTTSIELNHTEVMHCQLHHF